MKRSPLTLIVVAFAVALMLYVGFHAARRSGPGFAPHLTQSSLAPDFSLPSLDGKTLRLSDYRGMRSPCRDPSMGFRPAVTGR